MIRVSYLIKDYMRKDIVTIDAEASAVVASKTMMDNNIGYLIVLKNNQSAGIVTERDLVLKVMAKEREASKIKISDIMSTPLITIDPDTSVEDAVNTMVKHSIRRLPVVRDTILYGVFTLRNLALHFNEYEDEVVRHIIKSIKAILQDETRSKAVSQYWV